MRFDLIDLKLFVHVVEAGSITAGADRMHLAVAAASTRIRNMEIELGTALLNRERQGVQPTPAGRTLMHHARLLLQQAERMRGELGEYADGLKGHVRLLSNTNALTEFLPEPLSNFLTAHPQVNIDLEERLSDEIVAAVADGKADMASSPAPKTSPASKFSRFASIASCWSPRRRTRLHPPGPWRSPMRWTSISWAWSA
jgi:DNA-binding transcriptional LysR family regulator